MMLEHNQYVIMFYSIPFMIQRSYVAEPAVGG